MKDNIKECDDFLAMWEPIVDIVSFITYYDRIGTKDENKKLFQYWNEKALENYCCSQLFQRMLIVVDGTVVACCVRQQSGQTVSFSKREGAVSKRHLEQ